MSKAQKLKYINLGLSQKQINQLDEMVEESGFTKSQIIREAVNWKYEEMQKKLYGYSGVARTRAMYGGPGVPVAGPADRPLTAKQAQKVDTETRIKELEEMDIDTLNEWLREIGYITREPYVCSFNETLMEWKQISAVGGDKQLFTFYKSKVHDGISKETALDWNGFINDIKKKNLI